MLLVAATPIGNLDDHSPRLIERQSPPKLSSPSCILGRLASTGWLTVSGWSLGGLA